MRDDERLDKIASIIEASRAESFLGLTPSEIDRIYALAKRPSATAIVPVDPIKDLWDRGLNILGQRGRGLLGKMRKAHGDPAVIEAIVRCESEHPSDPASFFVACVSRSPLNGKHPGTYRPGPGAALFEGGYNAAEAYIDKHGLREADIQPDNTNALPLLDIERAGGGSPGTGGGLARRHR